MIVIPLLVPWLDVASKIKIFEYIHFLFFTLKKDYKNFQVHFLLVQTSKNQILALPSLVPVAMHSTALAKSQVDY